MTATNHRPDENESFPVYSDFTFKCEGGDSEGLCVHWPGRKSGATIGPGYDMKKRNKVQVIKDLMTALVPAELASRISEGAGLPPAEARKWVREHQDVIAPISVDSSKSLFRIIYPSYVAKAKGWVRNRGLDWNKLPSRIQEVLTDLGYRGDLVLLHRKKLLPALHAASEAMLRDALADYDYWQAHTKLEPARNGMPNNRIIARAVFLGATPPSHQAGGGALRSRPVPSVADRRSPAESQVGLHPPESSAANTEVFPIELRVQVLDSWLGTPVGYAEIEHIEIDHEPFQHPSILAKEGTLMTDLHGMVRIPVKPEVATRGFTLRLGFKSFAVIEEASHRMMGGAPNALRIVRPGGPNATPGWFHGGLRGEWLGPQSTAAEDPAWGWRARPPECDDPVWDLPEFRLWLEWTIPPTSWIPGVWTGIAPAMRPFSVHHEKDGQAEIVLFALRFCPPVFHTLASSVEWVIQDQKGKAVATPTGLERSVGMFMHTRFSAPAVVTSGGRDFGIFLPTVPPGGEGTRVKDGKWRRHVGIDLAANEGQSPVFAFTGGPVTLRAVVNGYGNVLQQRVDANRHAVYAHLQHPATVIVGTYLRAGQRIGTAGRTESAGSPSKPYPDYSATHLHFEITADGTLVPSTIRIHPVDWFTLNALPRDLTRLPGNEMVRLFPCDCETPDNIAKSCTYRGGSNTQAASDCWAARTEVCPYGSATRPLLRGLEDINTV